MGKKKVSDTLSQQRKARQEFLNLKKMESGEMAPEPKPSEVAVSPKTFNDKLKNFWFHYKWHTFFSVFTTIVLAITIAQCATKTDYDMKVVYFSYTALTDQMLEPVSDYLESLSGDINGDGEVNIQIINCGTSDSEVKTQYEMAILQKMQSIIIGEKEAMLYITDSKSVEYFDTDALSDFFSTEQFKFSDDFYETTKSELYGYLPRDLQIACRKVNGTTLENQKGIADIQKEAVKILEKLAQQ